MCLRITEGSNWDSYIAEGISSAFADCTSCDYVNNCVKYSKEVMLFLRSSPGQMVKLKASEDEIMRDSDR